MNSIQISGGLDSLALLFHLRPVWDDSVVMWANSGAAYSETAAMMMRISGLVPNFMVVHGNQPRVIEQRGFPVDVVPVKYSVVGELIFGPQPVKYQAYTDCCRDSLWVPMHAACLRLRVDTVYRGQRSEDRRKSPVRDGDVVDGMLYRFPLQEWTREKVWDYVSRECPEFIPSYYVEGEDSSHDCWNCTAYLDENALRIQHLPEDRRKVVTNRIAQWRSLVNSEIGGL